MFTLQQPNETDLYNETMDHLGPSQTNTNYSVWQAIPRDVNKKKGARVMAGGRAILRDFLKEENKEGSLELILLKDGMPFFPGDPVIQVVGEKSIARKLEPKILSTLFYMTGVATRTKELIDAIGVNRVIDVSMRGAAPGSWNYTAEAFLIGGGKLTATTGLRNVIGLEEGRDYTLVGTTGHSLYMEYLAAGYGQKEAFQEIVDKYENAFPGKPCALLVDTVDPEIGIKQALEVIREQKKKTGITHWIRLDSGDLLSQAKFALEKMVKDIPDFKVIIEDGLTKEKAVAYDLALEKAGFNPKKNILYGFGGYFPNNITRDTNGAWAYKPSVYRTTNNGNVNVIKLSATALKNSLPEIIGIHDNQKGYRLEKYGTKKKELNVWLNKKEYNRYMTQSIDELTREAKNYWKTAKNAPARWSETYDLSPYLTHERKQAATATKEFGYKNRQDKSKSKEYTLKEELVV